MQTTKSLNRECALRYLSWLNAQHYADSTQTSYCRVALRLCRFIKNKTLREVTPMDIGDFLTKTLPPKWSDGHVLYQLGALRGFFDFLYLGGIVDNVAPRFLRARTPVRKLPKTLTQSQMKKLITASDNREIAHWSKCSIRQAVASARSRQFELSALTSEDAAFPLPRSAKSAWFISVRQRRERFANTWGGTRLVTFSRHHSDTKGLPYLFPSAMDRQLARL